MKFKKRPDILRKLEMEMPTPSASKTFKNTTETSIRAVAEFEPMGGVLIGYPGTISHIKDHPQLPPTGKREFGIPDELIIRMQQLDSNHEPVHIFIMCDQDEDQNKKVLEALTNSANKLKLQFDPTLIHFVPWDTDTYWTRDYGPWWVQSTVDKSFSIAKHIYTSLGGGSVGMVEGNEEADPDKRGGIFRPNDDYAADKFSDFLNSPIRKINKENKNKKYNPHGWYFTGLLDVGGNYMVNGKGILASSYLVASQNELPGETKQQTDDTIVDNRMKYITEQANRFLGVNTYDVLVDPAKTYIGHIDCWGKFLDTDKILIAQSNEQSINNALNDIEDYFKQKNFKTYRVMCQPVKADMDNNTAAYTNSLILNDYVYVPIAGNNYKQNDNEAIQKYKEALPNHKVIPIIARDKRPWYGTDAMHCRTRGIPRNVVQNWLDAKKDLDNTSK